MKLMLTSFGIEDLDDESSVVENPFHRMPPVSFRSFNETFMPDYDLLVLCDEIIMDGESFEQLVSRPWRGYSRVAQTFKALHSEGRIKLVDFASTLRNNQPLLHKMIKHDLKVLDQWVEPLRQSLDSWRQFMDACYGIFREGRERMLGPHVTSSHPHTYLTPEMDYIAHSARNNLSYLAMKVQLALESSEKRKRTKFREPLRMMLEVYLKYVNANLILANTFQVGFHDWCDFNPFYSAKFLSIGKENASLEGERKQVEKLFTLAFPQYAIQDTTTLLKIVNDKRIEALRQLVTDAVAGKVVFNQEFANAVLMEVHKTHEKTGRFRKVLGYLTIPMELIPHVGTIAREGIITVAENVAERKAREKYQWFYMLSEIADSKDPSPNDGKRIE